MSMASNIFPPVGVIEIDGNKMSQQGVDADRVPASKVVIDDLVGQRYQEAVATVGAFDPGFLTNTGSPLVGTSG